MLREVCVFGALAPSPLIYFIIALLVFFILDRLVSQLGIYRVAWNPPLVRVCLFICMFWAFSLLSVS
jgi:hypothetical protein